MRFDKPVRGSVWVTLALAFLASGTSAANLATNPGFETGPDPGVMMSLGVGSTALTGWVVIRNAIDYSGMGWSAAEGARSVGLNGTGPGGVAQTLATVPNAEYTVSFYVSGNAFSSPILKHMRVSAAGTSQDYEFDTTHGWPWGMGWLAKTFVFTATSSQTTLEFYSLDSGDTGPTLDDVRVQGPTLDTPGATTGTLVLAPPHPNPMRDGCSIAFALPHTLRARLSVLDTQGRDLVQLADEILPSGRHSRRWDGTIAGRPAPAGVYYIRLSTPGANRFHKAVLSR